MPYKNKKKQKAAQQSYYQNNKAAYAASDKARLKANQQFVLEYKQRPDVFCSVCGESRWQCLEFHHTDPTNKTKNIAKMVKSRYSVATLKAEIEKCEVLCKNCHAVEHDGYRWKSKSVSRLIG